jgi:hypothetical protein
MQGKQPSSQALCKKFFTKLEGDENKYALVVHATNSDRWRCKCGCVHKKATSGGWSNLVSHIASAHPDAMTDNKAPTSPLHQYFTRECETFYSKYSL